MFFRTTLCKARFWMMLLVVIVFGVFIEMLFAAVVDHQAVRTVFKSYRWSNVIATSIFWLCFMLFAFRFIAWKKPSNKSRETPSS